MRFGFPYQYNQAPRRTKLAFANFALRLSLTKIFPFLFSPPAFQMLNNIKLTYKDVLTKANRTTRNIYLSALFLFTLPFTKQLFSMAKWFSL
jgi:kynurenine 3-monooxygenase